MESTLDAARLLTMIGLRDYEIELLREKIKHLEEQINSKPLKKEDIKDTK